VRFQAFFNLFLTLLDKIDTIQNWVRNMSINGISAIGNLGTGAAVSAASTYNADFSSVLNNSKSGSETSLDSIFEAASERYDVPVNLLKAVAKAESNFNANAKSSCGAMGIMQLMPATAESLGVSDAYDPEQNIMGGAKFLHQLLDEFDGDTRLAVAAYNAGPGNVEKYGGIPPFAETKNYVEKVMDYCGENISAGSIHTEKNLSDNASTQQQGALPAAAEFGDSDALSSMLIMTALQMQMQDESDDKDQAIV